MLHPVVGRAKRCEVRERIFPAFGSGFQVMDVDPAFVFAAPVFFRVSALPLVASANLVKHVGGNIFGEAVT